MGSKTKPLEPWQVEEILVENELRKAIVEMVKEPSFRIRRGTLATALSNIACYLGQMSSEAATRPARPEAINSLIIDCMGIKKDLPRIRDPKIRNFLKRELEL